MTPTTPGPHWIRWPGAAWTIVDVYRGSIDGALRSTLGGNDGSGTVQRYEATGAEWGPRIPSPDEPGRACLCCGELAVEWTSTRGVDYWACPACDSTYPETAYPKPSEAKGG